jgi:hypothetical protein
MESLREVVRENASVRLCVGLLVAALHLVVLMLGLTATWDRPEPATDSRALTLIDIEASHRTLPAVPPKEPTSHPTMREPRLGDVPRMNVLSTDEKPVTTDSAPIRDWHGSMAAAATAAVGEASRNENYRSLGPIERERAGSASAPSVFETPPRKAGDIDHDATQGRTLIWHDERCFTELRFPTIKDPNALVGAPNPPKCMRPIGEREARGDLFESIEKP